MIGLAYEGPDKYKYNPFLVEEPGWATELREHSQENRHGS